MANIKTRPLFKPFGMVTNAIATDAVENILERRDLFVPFGDWQDQGVTREEVIDSLKKLIEAGIFVTDQDLTHEDFDWEKIAGITLKSLTAKIELSLDQQPELDLEGKKGSKAKKAAKVDQTLPGTDEFTLGLATYRAVIEADPVADDVVLTVVRLTKLEEGSDAVDRFRTCLESHFAGYPKAWEFWQTYKESKASPDLHVRDRMPVKINDQSLTVGIRFYEEAGEFTGMVAIMDLINDSPIEEAEVNSVHEGFVYWEAYLDRTAPAEELPEEYTKVITLPIAETAPAAEAEAETPLFEFDLVIKGFPVSISVWPQSPGFSFVAVWYDAGKPKEQKMELSSGLADEYAAQEVAENWLKEIL